MIFYLWSHSHLWVVGWMDILTFFDILLKPPQPFTRLFLRKNIGVFQGMGEKKQPNLPTGDNDNQLPVPYLFEFYNVHPFNKLASGMGDDDCAIARIINALQDPVISRPWLPRFLIVVIDTDVLREINLDEEFNFAKDSTRWCFGWHEK